MENQPTGWRAVPASLLVAFPVWIVWAIVRTTLNIEWKRFSPKLILVGEGIGFACLVLMLVGTIELARRFAGPQRRGLQLAVAGAAASLVADLLVGLLQFTKNPWDHRWVYEVSDYATSAFWFLTLLGLALAIPAARRVVAFALVGAATLMALPGVLRETAWGWTDLAGNKLYVFETAFRVLRFGAMLALFVMVARGTTTIDRHAAGSGFRLSARSLWIRVIAAVAVVMLTLMMVGSRSSGGLEMFRVAMMAQGVVAAFALALFGIGALRAARAGIPELGSVTLTVGGTASLWAAGVTLAQLPFLYRMLYKGDDSYSRSDNMEWAQALSTAQPIVVIIGVALLATALSGYAARRGDETLRSEAQGKGIGFVALMLTAVAVQSWMLPKATSVGSFATLSILAAGAGLWGTVLMAKLLTRGAESIEAEAGLPPASIVNASGS